MHETPPRLLILSSEFPPLGGGLSSMCATVWEDLRERAGMAMDLITTGTQDDVQTLPDGCRIFRLGVKGESSSAFSKRELLRFAGQAARLALRLTRERRYDGCLAWSTVPAGAVALLLRRMRSLPYAVVLSGSDVPGFTRRFRHLYPLLRPLLTRTWRRAEAIVAGSDALAATVLELVPSGRVERIPNCVDIRHFTPGERHEADVPRLLCVSRLLPHKGQQHLLEAAALLQAQGVRFHLTLIGDGVSASVLRAQTQQLGLRDVVTFAGMIDRQYLPPYYQAADVFALPSFNEVMSVALLEAAACGLALVTTQAGNTGGIVQEGRNGFVVEWANPGQLAQRLALLLQDAALRRRFGDASRERAPPYAREAVTTRYAALVRELFALRAAQARHRPGGKAP